MTSSEPPLQQLESLLLRTHDEPTLRILFAHLGLDADLPGGGVTMRELAHRAARVLDQRGRVDVALFQRLADDAGTHRAEVLEVAQAFGLSLPDTRSPRRAPPRVGGARSRIRWGMSTFALIVLAPAIWAISGGPAPVKPTGGPTGRAWTTSAIPEAQITFIELSDGRYSMGSPAGKGDGDEHPQHPVEVQRFWLGQTEVTQAQWAAVVREAHQRADPDATRLVEDPSAHKGSDRPVEQLSWCDALRFANAASRIEGLLPAYTLSDDCTESAAIRWDPSATGFRLPTEAEWEYAAHAGTTTRYPTGESDADLAKIGWFNANSGNVTHPVCAAKERPWSICDLAGNAWEWTWDVFEGSYLSPFAADPADPPDGMRRVLRGGSAYHGTDWARPVDRDTLDPTWPYTVVGVRLARSGG